MPRKEIDYSKTVMYKIVCNDLRVKDLYVGHTTDFTKRKNGHKTNCSNVNSKLFNLKVYKCIRDNGEWPNWSMILIEKYPCNDQLDATKRERYWYEQLNATLNSQVPSRTKTEYFIEHKDNKKEYDKQFYKANSIKLLAYQKQYIEKNLERIADHNKQYRINNNEKKKEYQNAKIFCPCGCTHSRSNKLRHELSKQHQEYEQNRLMYTIRRGLDLIKLIDNQFNAK